MSKRKTAEELEEIIERLRPWAMDAQDSNTLRVLRDAVKSIDQAPTPAPPPMMPHMPRPPHSSLLAGKAVRASAILREGPMSPYHGPERLAAGEEVARRLLQEALKAGAISFREVKRPGRFGHEVELTGELVFVPQPTPAGMRVFDDTPAPLDPATWHQKFG